MGLSNRAVDSVAILAQSACLGVAGEVGLGVAAEVLRGLAAGWFQSHRPPQQCRCECPHCHLIRPPEVISKAWLLLCVTLALLKGVQAATSAGKAAGGESAGPAVFRGVCWTIGRFSSMAGLAPGSKLMVRCDDPEDLWQERVILVFGYVHEATSLGDYPGRGRL
jgi:hypothetical protein